MSDEGLENLTAIEAAAAIRDGRLKSRELTEACLAQIERLEPTVGAWTFLDRDHALAQADAADDIHRHGRPHGPLHGVPVGVKDIFDTHDMPTEDGTPLHAGRTPRRDAAAVAKLRQAGAVIMGKTVTTELACYTPGKTANPRDPARTPGGSSSGSAAAVAADMVPLAIGSQTNGSTIRPAAFCGVYGFKPSHGLIARSGMLQLSRALDHVGVFARAIEDAALIAECMIGHDENDPDTRPLAAPPLQATATSERHAPLLPESHYAAGKLAGEAILSGFAHLYGWRALAFRFGNTVGSRSNHGVVHDFVAKLLRDPARLEILGDGRQAKPYVAVEDVAGAMLHAEIAAPSRPFGVYNVGTEGVVTVDRIGDLVIEALHLQREAVERRYTGRGGGWRGDTERVELDLSALGALGWRPAFSAEEALTRAAIGARERLAASGPPYLTTFERRAADRAAKGASQPAPAAPAASR